MNRKDNHHVNVLLLAGGLGQRLRPLTDTVPKCLVPIAGRPLLDYWIDRFTEAGLHDVLINTHHLPEPVRRYAERVNETGRVHLREFFEPKLLGSAGTVHANRDLVPAGGECLIVYADNLSNVDLGAMLDSHRAMRADFTMLLFRSPTPERCGIAQLDGGGRIVAFEEKPAKPIGNLANAGIYAMSAAAYHEAADMNRFDLGFDVLPAFAGRMHGWVFDGYHRDIGTLESLRQAESDVAAGLIRMPGAHQGGGALRR
jgi:mannose-1-phosphate guanylyltransferase